jgi:hypothetical protein
MSIFDIKFGIQLAIFDKYNIRFEFLSNVNVRGLISNFVVIGK